MSSYMRNMYSSLRSNSTLYERMIDNAGYKEVLPVWMKYTISGCDFEGNMDNSMMISESYGISICLTI